MDMKQARALYKRNYSGRGPYSFRQWARSLIASGSVSFARPVGKLARIAGIR